MKNNFGCHANILLQGSISFRTFYLTFYFSRTCLRTTCGLNCGLKVAKCCSCFCGLMDCFADLALRTSFPCLRTKLGVELSCGLKKSLQTRLRTKNVSADYSCGLFCGLDFSPQVRADCLRTMRTCCGLLADYLRTTFFLKGCSFLKKCCWKY